ncbi:MAG: hypothetical protein RJA99_1668 [Pseudomonadota bacterium]
MSTELIASPVVVCGTPGRRATALSDALLAAARGYLHPGRSPGGTWIAVAPGATGSLGDLRSGAPDSRFVVVVEGPAGGMARALDEGDTADPRSWADAWRTCAVELLEVIHADPSRVLVLEAGDAAARPEQVIREVSNRFGQVTGPLLVPTPSQRPAIDPLCLALAYITVATDPALRRLAAELEAACIWLDERSAPPPIAPEGDCPDLVAASWSLHGLRDAIRRLEAERTSDTRKTAALLESGRNEVDALTARLGAAEQDFKAARTESELLVMQLHRVQEDLESQFVARREAEARLQAALEAKTSPPPPRKLDSAELNAARQECEMLVMQLHRVQADLETAFVARREAESVLQQARGECDALRQALAVRDASLPVPVQVGSVGAVTASGQAQIEQLKRQINAQIEREARSVGRLREELASLRDRMEFAPGRAWDGRLRFDDPIPLEEHRDLPFRGLTLALRGVAAGDRTLQETRIRLVEHHGHPGLVVFRDSDGPSVLESWIESGRENDRPYALLVPVDTQCRPAFDSLSRRDWSFLMSLTARLEQIEFGEAFVLGAFWRTLARRLHESLLELPPRCRFGRVTAVEADEGGPVAFDFTLEDVACGHRRLDQLRVHWQAFETGAKLRLMTDPRLGPPLNSWPGEASPAGVAALEFDLRPAPDAAATAERFNALSAADRSFVVELLRCWPSVLRASLNNRDDHTTLIAAAAAAWREIVAIASPAPAAAARPTRLADRAKRVLLASVQTAER